MTPALALEAVEVRLGATVVLRRLSLAVAAGEVLALLGPSGAGKTTVLRLLLGFLPPDRGAVRLSGATVSADGRVLRPPEERNLAVVFQDLALWPHLTVAGNLGFGLEARRMARPERERRIAEMIQRVGLGGKERRRPGELSGGERQRVAIARALVLEPVAVLLDEPLSNLDPALRRELLSTFREMLAEHGTTAIYVTHEPREAASLGDRIAVLEEGAIVQVGTSAELAVCPATRFVQSLLEDLSPRR